MVGNNVVNQIYSQYENMLDANPVYKAEEQKLFLEKTEKPLSEFEAETKKMFKKNIRVSK